MAGVPMVQPTPFSSRKPGDHRDLYHCQYCKELRLAKDIQSPSINKESFVMTFTLLSFGPLAYYIWSGSEIAFVAWLFSVLLLAVF